MSYQFIHYETYNSSEIKNVINENLRTPGFCPHVESPNAKILYSNNADDLLKKIDDLMISTKRKVTQMTRSKELKTFERSIREKDDIALAGVISWEREWSSLNKRLYEESKKEAIEKLKKDYKHQLKLVISHDDEAHPHIHFIVLPDDLDISNVCVAAAAEKRVDQGKQKNSGKERLIARTKALKDFQARWNEEVFAKQGLTQYGPRLERISRKEWKIKKSNLNIEANLRLKSEDTAKNLAAVKSAMLIQHLNHKKEIDEKNIELLVLKQNLNNETKKEHNTKIDILKDLLDF